MGILCILGIAVLIILLVPISFRLTANNTRGLHIGGRVSYGHGIISCGYQGHGGQSEAAVKVLGIPVYSFSPRESGKHEQDVRVSDMLSSLRARRKLLDYIPGIARDILKTIMGREAALRLRLGFEDPAYTGMVAGLMACILVYCRGALEYTPDFSGKNFEVDLYLKGVIIPVVLIFIGAKHGALYLKDLLFERNNVKGGRRYEFNG